MSELFDAVDALVASAVPLPSSVERKRLRKANGLTVEQVATALKVRPATVSGWESGKEPRSPEREAYARLLSKLAALLTPAEGAALAPTAETFTGPQSQPAPQPAPPASESESEASAPASASESGPSASESESGSVASASVEERVPRRSAPVASRPLARATPVKSASVSVLRRSGVKGAVKKPAAKSAAVTDARFENGPLAVVDADEDRNVVAYCVGGLVLDVPAKSLPSLVEWALREAKLGAPRLDDWGQDADPLLVLTEAALERYGLPPRLTEEERLAGRLPENHKVARQLARAEWKLTQRGLGPWARIYRPAEGSRRRCVQLCIPPWNALDDRAWGGAAQLPPADLARLLGIYAQRVMTPCGSTAVTGLELMTALHPPTRAGEPDEDGTRRSVHNPGSLGKEPVACAPCEAPDGHPLLAGLPRFHQRGGEEMLVEEAYDWARGLTDEECMKRYLVGLDVNLAFGAAANGAVVGLACDPVHVTGPQFDPKLPGAWLVDLSHVDLSHVKVGRRWRQLRGDLLPSPFTPTGEKPRGPAWYATPTVEYAVELGYDVAPIEAYVRPDSGRYLDRWYKRLRNAYVDTMADLGVEANVPPQEFLAAMDGYRQRDPLLAVVVSAIKATVKGAVGKLRERPRGGGWKPGESWPALERPTWRPDIRAVMISRARISMHRKILNLAAATGQYPAAVLSDCAVYASGGPSPLDVLPYDEAGKTVPGSFRLGVSPGMVKHEGTQTTLWAEDVRERWGPELNLARYIKDGQVAAATGDGQ